MRSRSIRACLCWWVAGVALAGAAASMGCEGQIGLPTNLLSTTGSAPTMQAETPEEMFHMLEPELVAACGACHDAGGAANKPFLAGPDRYRSTVSWPGIVVSDPTKSLFLTHAIQGGGHSGKNLDDTDLVKTLLPEVTEWLRAESKHLSSDAGAGGADPGRTIAPFSPILGFNTVRLDAFGPEFDGIAITFSAKEASATSLELSQVEVHPTKQQGVHLVHPLFSVFPAAGGAGSPDPADSFKGVDGVFEADKPGPLGPGSATLTNWSSGGKLGIRFDLVEVAKNQPDAGT